ncbi:hypothetical protein JCM5350_007181 [Sporobolomyces pararoseus]
MNSLPPELLSSIIEQAAHCDSTYDSYRSRLRTLSALSLVNRILRDLAQPLLPQKVWFQKENEFERFRLSGMTEKVARLNCNFDSNLFNNPNSQGFSFMKELRICDSRRFNIAALDQHHHLKRFALESTTFNLANGIADFALPHLEELSIAHAFILGQERGTPTPVSSFLTPSHFPSLRALGIKSLDCVTLDEWGYRDLIRSRRITPGSSLPPFSSIPLLFDVDDSPSPYITESSVYTNSHVRLRLVSNSIADTHRAISNIEALFTQSTISEELYLDTSCQNEDGDQGFIESFGGKTSKFEKLAEQKKVELIWENQEDDCDRG